MADTERFPGQTDPFVPVVPHSLRNLTPDYWGEVDWEGIAGQEIEQEVLDVLDFDLALEGHVPEIVLYLHLNRTLRRKDLAGESIAGWQVEEAFHEIALHNVLRHHIKDMPDRSTFRRRELSRQDRIGGLLRPVGALATGVLTPQFAMAMSVYNGVKAEALSYESYDMTADLTENEALSYLLRQIALQEAGYGHMFQSWGRNNPPSESVQRRVRRAALRTPFVVVGEGFQPTDRIARVVKILSNHPEFKQKMLGVDRRIDKLPGLEGMHVVERYIGQMLGS